MILKKNIWERNEKLKVQYLELFLFCHDMGFKNMSYRMDIFNGSRDQKRRVCLTYSPLGVYFSVVWIKSSWWCAW